MTLLVYKIALKLNYVKVINYRASRHVFNVPYAAELQHF